MDQEFSDDTPLGDAQSRRVAEDLLIRERSRLVRVALRAIVGDDADRLQVRDGDDLVRIGDPGDATGHFGVWTTDEQLGDEPPPYLEHVIDLCTDELTETRTFWGMRLPVCPVHPDVHALALEIGDGVIVGRCPVAGVVRTVAF